MKRVLSYMLLLVLTVAGPVVADEVLAIKADRVDTVGSGIIQNGIIIVRNGRITAVGADVEIPYDATVIDANDKTVFPGLVNPFSQIGLSSGGGGASYIIVGGQIFFTGSSGSSSASNPHYRVVDELYSNQDVYARVLRAGFTTLALSPGRGTIAGQGAVVRPVGDRSEDMILSESGLVMSYFSAGQGQARLKSALDSGKRNPSSTDPRIEPLARVVKGEIPLIIKCDSPAGTLHLLKVLKGFDKVKPVLICGPENIHVAEQLAKRKIPVIVPAEINTEANTANKINVVYTLAKAGIKIACHPVTDSVEGHEDYLRQMGQLVKSGLDKEVAKRAMTLHPAQMLGLEYRIGSIEVGKDANLLILSGDPFVTGTQIERIIIEGKTVHER